MFHSPRLLTFCASILGLASVLAAQAQPPASTQRPGVLTANARLVVLDVVVTDKSGKLIDGLTEKDFQVFEDGKQQRIRSVEAPSAHMLPANSTLTAFDPAQPAAFGQSPVNILVLDQLNTHFADASYARRQMRDYLTSLPARLAQPTTLLAVFDNHFKLLQGFTRDRDALEHALEAAPTQYGWKLEVNGRTDHGPIERLDESLRALEEMAQSYARVPGRKNLIWVGGGFPSMDPAALSANDIHEVEDAIHHVTNVLLDTRVTLYAVDPATTLPGMAEITDATQMAFVLAAGDSMVGGVDPFSGTLDFDRLGPLTGGRVIRGRNDIAEQIADSVDLGANFYTIAYTPSSTSDAKAKFRKIRVVCLRADLTAATRNGYYNEKTEPATAIANASYDLTTAAETSIPLNGLHLTVEPAHDAGSYIVHVGAPDLTWKARPRGDAIASVYVMAVALNGKNKMLAHVDHPMTASAPPDTPLDNAAKTADFLIAAPSAPKAAALRFVVRDSASGRMGSVDLPLPHP